MERRLALAGLAMAIPTLVILIFTADMLVPSQILLQVTLYGVMIEVAILYLLFLVSYGPRRPKPAPPFVWFWLQNLRAVLLLADLGVILIGLAYLAKPLQDPLVYLNENAATILAAIILLGLSSLFNATLCKLAGQRNQGLFGASLTGAAGFGRIASEMLSVDFDSGILYLTRSLQYLNRYFNDQGQTVAAIPSVLASLETLQSYPTAITPHALTRLANGLARLPDMQELSSILGGFLKEVGWSGTIETVRVAKRSRYDLLVLTAALLAGLGAFLPEGYRSQIISSLGSSPALELAIIFLGGYAVVRTLGTAVAGTVDPQMLRKYKSILEH